MGLSYHSLLNISGFQKKRTFVEHNLKNVSLI